jgi:hypothetical protein
MNKPVVGKINRIHFPTALGLLILFLAIGFGIYWAKTKTATTPTTSTTGAPKQVKITNVSDTGFSVSWVSDQAASGKVKLGTETSALKDQVNDDRDQLSGETGSFEVHHLTAKNLKANTKYYFKIESGGKAFDNQGKPFEVTTGPTLGNPPTADPIYGTVLSGTHTPAEGVIVYINLANAAPLSALVKSGGNWALSLSTARTTDLKTYLAYDTQASIVNLLAQGGKQGTAPAITLTANDSPVPDIVLGQSHDFRAQNLPSPTPTLTANGATPSGQTSTSGFSLDPLIAQTDTATPSSGAVTLENPSVDGEVINATQPAFIGSGPPGTVLAITINSPLTYTGTATVTSTGDWEFVPPQGLAAGSHEITIAYLDTEGIEQTLTRTFVIAAAGETEVPAITATPSGSTSTDSGRTSMPSTSSGVPKPGAGDLSLIIIVIALGLLIGGLHLKKVV